MAASDLALPGPGSKSGLDRFLSLFTVVRPGEGVTAVLLALNIFLFFVSYYILKTVRESLILGEYGAVVKSYSSAGQALLLMALVPAYGMLASKVNRIRFITWVTLLFISNLVIFGLVGGAGGRIGVVFYIWLGIYNNMVPAQFWGFANDLYSEEQGKRLFPMIGVGASLGSWIGALIAGRAFRELGPYNLMVCSGAVLVACILLARMAHLRESGRADPRRQEQAGQPLGREGGFRLVLSSPYLRWIALLIMLLNLVNTTGEFLLGSVVEREADQRIGSLEALRKEAPQNPEAKEKLAALEKEKKAIIGEFYGSIFAWVNLTGLLIQTLVVSHVFRLIGVRGALFVLPLIVLTGYSVLIALPVLAIVRVIKILENATDYSLQNTVRHALFLPTSREAKYKAKAAVDTFFPRAGDTLQAVVVFGGTTAGLGAAGFGVMNIVFIAFWLLVAGAIHREHKKIAAQA